MKKTRTALFSSLAASDTLFLPYTRKEVDPFLLSEIAQTIGKEGTLLLPVDAEAASLYASGKNSSFFAKSNFPSLEKTLSLWAKVVDGDDLPGATLLLRLAVSRFFVRHLSEEADLSLFEKGENGAPVFPTPDPALLIERLTAERRIEEATLHGKKWLLYTANDLVNAAECLFEKEPAAYFGEAIAALLKTTPPEEEAAVTAEGRAFLDTVLPPKLFDANLFVSEADIDPHTTKSLIGAREAFWLRTDALPDLLFEKNQLTAVTVTEDMTCREIEEAVDADLHTAALRYSFPISDKGDAFAKTSLLSFLMKLAGERGLALYIDGLTEEEDFAKLGKLYKRRRRAVLLLPLAGLMKRGMPPKALIKLSKGKRVYFDITDVNDPMSLALFDNLFGTDRLLFGSGGKLQKNLFAFCRAAAELHFTKGEIAAILYENAAKIFLS